MTAPCPVPSDRIAPPRGLLDGVDGSGRSVPYAEHLRRYRALPPRSADGADFGLVYLVERSGLLGRGGAGFPTGRKLRSVAEGGRRPVVVANGMEAEPASYKDALLLAEAPHVVLDGIVLAARAVGATDAYLCVHNGASTLPALRRALAERDPRADGVRIAIEELPTRYVSSESSSLAHWLGGGAAVPLFEPRPHERGVGARPTLVQNVETLANLALIARFGPDWLRRTGTPDEPGSLLVTLGGAVRRPGVVEVPIGTPIGEVLARGGAEPERLSAILVGGYFGGWVPIGQAMSLPLSHAALRSVGLGLGAGIVVALPAEACGVTETARVAAYLVRESAGQCGPCRFGLPAIAGALDAVAHGAAGPAAVAAVERWSRLVDGRGACHFPDGAVRFVTSALRTFHADVTQHVRWGRCAGTGHPRVLPLPATGADR